MRAREWHCGPFDFDLATPLVMGICNVTPDSFSDGGMHASASEALEHAKKLIAARRGHHRCGWRVDSSRCRRGAARGRNRPRLARRARARVAWRRGEPVDTRHASVAEACIDAGACIVNDVSGFRSADMREVAARGDAGLVVMHMRGTPKTMAGCARLRRRRPRGGAGNDAHGHAADHGGRRARAHLS